MTTITTPAAAALTSAEQNRLHEFESTIERGLQTFYEVGYALAEIREQRLYRATYDTFEDYCRERWQMRRDYANKLISASEVMGNLNTIVSKPANEAQTRPLAKLPPEEQAPAWEEAVERSGGKPTARVVEQVVQERTRQRIDSMPADERMQLFEKLKRRRLRINGGSYNDGRRDYHFVRDVHAYGDMHERHTITYVDEAEELMKMVVPPAPPSRWARPAEPEEPEEEDPPLEKDAFENMMAGALEEEEAAAAAASIEQIFTPEPDPEPAAARRPKKDSQPEPVPDDIIELLRTVDPEAGLHSFEARLHWNNHKLTQYRTSVPTGSGGGILTDWHSAAHLRQWMENHIEKLQEQISENVKGLHQAGFQLSGDVVWQRVGQHRLLPFYPLTSNMYNPELWSETQVQTVLVMRVRMNDRIKKEQDEVSKARKQLSNADARRYEAEQRVKILEERIAAMESGSE